MKYAGSTALTGYAIKRLGILKAIAQIPGGTLDANLIPKFQTPLLIPPIMPRAGRIVVRGGKNVDYYEISMKQFNQQILPAGLPHTTVWGYRAVSSESKKGLLRRNGANEKPQPKQTIHESIITRTCRVGLCCFVDFYSEKAWTKLLRARLCEVFIIDCELLLIGVTRESKSGSISGFKAV